MIAGQQAGRNFGISTRGWFQQPLGPRVLESIHAAGFRRIELFANRPHMDFGDRGLQKTIAAWFSGADVDAPALHLPVWEPTGRTTIRWISPLSAEPIERQESLDQIKRALELTDRVGCAYALVHLGIPGQDFNPVLWERAYALVRTIQEHSGIRVLLETLDNAIATPERLREFIATTRLDHTAVCYDIGHRRPGEDWPDLDGIELVHLDDNDGDSDAHQLPFDGSIRWPEFVSHVVENGYNGSWVLEAHTDDAGAGATAASRLDDMMSEARDSIEEFRNRHGIAAPRDRRDGP